MMISIPRRLLTEFSLRKPAQSFAEQTFFSNFPSFFHLFLFWQQHFQSSHQRAITARRLALFYFS